MHDLVDHMHGAHPLENDGIKCHDCWKEFQVQSDLVMHIQNAHINEAKLCTHFIETRCIFGDSCWFKHNESKQVAEFKCIYCDSTFKSKSDLMSHCKREHPNKVNQYKNEQNEKCIHETNDTLKKLFNMMETLCEGAVSERDC